MNNPPGANSGELPVVLQMLDIDVKDLLFKHLSEKEKTIVAMYYYEGLSMREIATMLRLTESRICQIHAKVIKRLKDVHEMRKAELFA